jgi:hypothetical protein
MTKKMHPMRCCDNYLEDPIKCICRYFWWDAGPLDESGETTTDWYRSYACQRNDRSLKPCGIKHTQVHGCVGFMPDYTAEERGLESRSTGNELKDSSKRFQKVMKEKFEV